MARKKILMVEDDIVVLVVMRRFLVEKGYDVVTTQESGMAVSLALSEKPDLILLDLGFEAADPFSGPNFDGFTVIDFLHYMIKEVDIPIIVITGQTAPDIRQRALDAGAVAFFQKPADRKKVLSAIRIALEQV